MRFKSIMRFEPFQRKFRLFRVMWERGMVGDGVGYSAKVVLSLVPAIASYSINSSELRVTLFGLSLHYRRSYGGIFV